ncbi:hypothetical protein EJ08DRAFT_635168 [Tothia fuscella]|uniref:alpha-galactosidase n=1 Tax=Tothia fuscella TaxID=1048955 RepID=A0A9P4NPW7_9PEZI|nr:hypothetical protein EJ08DRAFT_635168 [Tothia fuscella]
MYAPIYRALLSTAIFGSAIGAAVPAVLSERDTQVPTVWAPEVGSTYQIILTNSMNLESGLVPNVDIYDLDLYDTDISVIGGLHAAGKKVVCYFSAGTSEDWRADWAEFKEKDKGACLPQWAGERWLNTRSADVWNTMAKRIAFANEKGCDAIDPDNMEIDGYSNENGGGLGLTTRDAATYARKLAAEAAKYGMGMGLKNAQEILGSVRDVVQFAVNEECAANEGDCQSYQGFGKPVYHIEYVNSRSVSSNKLRQACNMDSTFTTVIKTLNLDGWVTFCDGKSYTTPTNYSAPNKGRKDCLNSKSARSLGLVN